MWLARARERAEGAAAAPPKTIQRGLIYDQHTPSSDSKNSFLRLIFNFRLLLLFLLLCDHHHHSPSKQSVTLCPHCVWVGTLRRRCPLPLLVVPWTSTTESYFVSLPLALFLDNYLSHSIPIPWNSSLHSMNFTAPSGRTIADTGHCLLSYLSTHFPTSSSSSFIQSGALCLPASPL